MRKLMGAVSKLITGKDTSRPHRKRYTNRDLIAMESKIGAQLFGPVQKGHRREFFCLDEHTWVWYEEWLDASGKRQSVTTRYEVHQTGILKVQDGHPYQVVEGEELRNLAMATRMYREHVIQGMYGRDHVTGKPLAAA